MNAGDLIRDPDGWQPVPGAPYGGITRDEWHALLDGLLELERAGALGGIRAITAERLRRARGHLDDGYRDGALLRAAQAELGTDPPDLARAAALLAAAIDREAGG